MTREEILNTGLIEAFVLGNCTKDEEQMILSLRKTDETINQAIIDFEKKLEETFFARPLQVSEKTDHAIAEYIKSKTSKTVQFNAIPKKQPVNYWKYIAAAASAALIVSLYFNVKNIETNKNLKQEIIDKTTLTKKDYDVLTNPAITPVALMGQGYFTTCRCSMYWDKEKKKAYIMIHHLIEQPDTKDYQLWAIVDGKPVSVGLVDEKVRGKFFEVDGVVPEQVQAFAVSLENKGGSTTPSKDIFLKGTT